MAAHLTDPVITRYGKLGPNGTKWVVFHGYLGDPSTFLAFDLSGQGPAHYYSLVGQLLKAHPEDEVVLINLPDRTPDEAFFRAIWGQVCSGQERPVILVGFSRGGQIAAQFLDFCLTVLDQLQQSPGLGLVLVSTPGDLKCIKPWGQRFLAQLVGRYPALRSVAKWIFRCLPDLFTDKQMLRNSHLEWFIPLARAGVRLSAVTAAQAVYDLAHSNGFQWRYPGRPRRQPLPGSVVTLDLPANRDKIVNVWRSHQLVIAAYGNDTPKFTLAGGLVHCAVDAEADRYAETLAGPIRDHFTKLFGG